MKLVVVAAFLLVFLVVVLAGRLGWFGAYGYLRPSLEVTENFQKARKEPGHDYYVSGPLSNPDAILAVDRTRQVELVFWQPVDPHPGLLADLVARMAPVIDGAAGPMGYEVLDHEGKRLGYWYSPFAATSITFRKEKMKIAVPDTRRSVWDSASGDPGEPKN